MEMDSKRNRVEFDRINELQDDILIHIFSFLSIEDNVRASFVCTRWKSLWSPHSVLDLDCKHFCKNFKNSSQEAQREKFINFVNSVLVLDQHQQHLEELRLVMDLCKFAPPRYGHFESLQTVILKDAVLVKNAVNYLIDRCPVLEELYLIDCTVSSQEFDVSASTSELKCLVLDFSCGFKGQVYSVNICVPSVLKFKYVGDLLDNFSVSGFDNLIEADIYFTKACFSFGQSRSLHNMIRSLSNANSTLTLDRWSLKLLGTILFDPTELDGNLPCPFYNLKHLRLRSSLGDSELEGLHRLVRSSPSIETLSIKLSPSRHYPDNFWESQPVPFDCLQHLKIIEIKGFYGLISEMKFLKYMLANALVLKKIIICKGAFRSGYVSKERDEINKGLFLAKQEKAIEVLLGFARASLDVQILLP